MAQTRKKHPQPPRKSNVISEKQKQKGRTIWVVLFGIFGLAIAYFASDGNLYAMIIGLIVGATIGYFVGKNLEEKAGRS